MKLISPDASFNRLRQLFWLFCLATLAYVIWIKSYLSPLTSGEILRFEIAKTVEKARYIIQEWKNTGKYEKGVESTQFAFLFIFLYSFVLILGCRFVSACTQNEILKKGGFGFAYLVGFAALCDILENLAMSRTLHGRASAFTVNMAYNLARIKFSVVIVCVLFILTCALYWVIDRLSRIKS